MKAYRISSDGDITPLPLPTLRRGTYTDPVPYRLQAAGELPLPVQKLDSAQDLRTITLSGSTRPALFKKDPTLNIVCTGSITVKGRPNQISAEAGDLLLVEGGAEPDWSALPQTRLIQFTINASWPGTEAIPQDDGSIMPRESQGPAFMRVFEAEDGRSYFAPFPDLFGASTDTWTQGRPAVGFRLLRFPDGAFIDWHPEVVNNLAVFLSGEMEIEARGPEPIARFRAGDVLLAEDRKGEGHIDRVRGDLHLLLLVLDDAVLWPAPQSRRVGSR